MPVRNKFHRQRQRSLYFAAIHLKLTFQHRKKLKLAEAGSKFFLLKNSPFHKSKNKALMGADITLAVLPYCPLRHLTAEPSQIQHWWCNRGPFYISASNGNEFCITVIIKMLIPITWDVMVSLCRIIMMVSPGEKRCQYLSSLYSQRCIGSLSL